MVKKQIRKLPYIFLISLMALFFISDEASAYQLISKDDPNNAIASAPYYFASDDAIRVDYATGKVKKHTISIFYDSNFTQAGSSGTSTANNYFNAVGLTCVGYYIVTQYGTSGEQIAEIRVQVEEGDLVDPRCQSSGVEEPEPDTGGSGGDCDSCAILNCPGWDEYMGKIDDIIDEIPPPPNWDLVSEIFTDTIAPRIKDDLQDVIGTAPTPPPPPPPPFIDYPDLDPPTGDLPDGFEDSGFTLNDIKDSAPTIDVREDPTGGFDITDPIGGLPSQEEFMDNVPDEGEAEIPDPPEEGENIAPEPQEEDNVPPMPQDTTDNAPIPSDTTDTAPIPNDGATAPIPNEDLIPPLPNGDSSKAPIPGDDAQFTAPIP